MSFLKTFVCSTGILTALASSVSLSEPVPTTTQIYDADGDGLADQDEIAGWTVAPGELDDRSVTRRRVTSDAYARDTDGDGVTDREELHFGLDPRAADTDGDGLPDARELPVDILATR